MKPNNPHAIIEIELPNNQGTVTLDSWEQKSFIESVKVELVKNETSSADIVIYDPNFKVIDSLTTENGVEPVTVKIYLGFGEDLGEPHFKGILAEVERGSSTTTFTVYDMGFKMKLEKKPGYHNKKGDIEILKTLATRNGLKFEGPEKALKLEPYNAITQDEQTDWEHAMERARNGGLEIYVRQDTFFAKYPPKPTTPILSLTNRKNFELKNDFDFFFRTPEGKEREVKVRGRGKGGKRVEGNAKLGMLTVKKETETQPTVRTKRRRRR